MDKSIKALTVTCICAWLFGSCIITKLKAEDVVTGNILPNAGNSVSSYNGGSTPVISTIHLIPRLTIMQLSTVSR